MNVALAVPTLSHAIAVVGGRSPGVRDAMPTSMAPIAKVTASARVVTPRPIANSNATGTGCDQAAAQ
jgi:hypothetical protein